MMLMLTKAKMKLSTPTPFSDLYLDEFYKAKCIHKLAHMKRLITFENVTNALKNNGFWKQVKRVKALYPHHGNRKMLYYLTGNILL